MRGLDNQFLGYQNLTFALNWFTELHFLWSLEMLLQILGAAKGPVTITHLKFRIFIDLNLASFLESMNFQLSEKQKQPSRGVLSKRCSETCSKFTGEHPCRSVISIKLFCNFIKITLRHGCSPVNLLHIFRTPFLKNTSGRLLLE